MAKQQKEKKGCMQRLFRTLLIFAGILIFLSLISSDSDKENQPSTQTTATPVITASTVPTATPTITPTEEPFEIILKHPELGEYGVYYTFNEKVEKAEESDKETIIQCFVPAGVYTVTNIDRSPWTFVYVYSKETRISDFGWEEPAETWVSPMLKVGESCEVTIPEGWYINLQEQDHFKLVLNK